LDDFLIINHCFQGVSRASARLAHRVEVEVLLKNLGKHIVEGVGEPFVKDPIEGALAHRDQFNKTLTVYVVAQIARLHLVDEFQGFTEEHRHVGSHLVIVDLFFVTEFDIVVGGILSILARDEHRLVPDLVLSQKVHRAVKARAFVEYDLKLFDDFSRSLEGFHG
jgi:hypothetical protein